MGGPLFATHQPDNLSWRTLRFQSAGSSSQKWNFFEYCAFAGKAEGFGSAADSTVVSFIRLAPRGKGSRKARFLLLWRGWFPGQQFEAGRNAFLEVLGKMLQGDKTGGLLGSCMPELRPFPERRSAEKSLLFEAYSAQADRFEDVRHKKRQHHARAEVAADPARFYFVFGEPVADAEFGGIEIMTGLFVQGLQESRVDHYRTAGLQHAQDFLCRFSRIGQMFEDVERKDAIENVVTKRQMMSVADHIGVPENLVFELDTIRITRGGPTSADVENKILPVPEDGFEFRPEWIA